ncbi:unnamed protein product [Camellia sinensis]
MSVDGMKEFQLIYCKVFLEIKVIQLPNPFPRLTYAEVMSQYGLDRPDVRFDLELRDVIRPTSLSLCLVWVVYFLFIYLVVAVVVVEEIDLYVQHQASTVFLIGS